MPKQVYPSVSIQPLVQTVKGLIERDVRYGPLVAVWTGACGQMLS